MTASPDHTIVRKFSASRSEVWKAFTDPVIVNQWYGPNVDTVIHAFDFKPGGVWRHEMKMGERSSFSQMVFQEIADQQKVSWHHSMTDGDWNPAPNPMMSEWPKVVLNSISFSDDGNDTEIQFTQMPIDPSDPEKECFTNMVSKMDAGWSKGFDIIDGILAG